MSVSRAESLLGPPQADGPVHLVTVGSQRHETKLWHSSLLGRRELLHGGRQDDVAVLRRADAHRPDVACTDGGPAGGEARGQGCVGPAGRAESVLRICEMQPIGCVCRLAGAGSRQRQRRAGLAQASQRAAKPWQACAARHGSTLTKANVGGEAVHGPGVIGRELSGVEDACTSVQDGMTSLPEDQHWHAKAGGRAALRAGTGKTAARHVRLLCCGEAFRQQATPRPEARQAAAGRPARQAPTGEGVRALQGGVKGEHSHNCRPAYLACCRPR